MKETKCKNCGASFAPSDKFCSYCKSVRPVLEGTEKEEKNDENNESPAKQVINTFKKLGLNSIVLENMFDSLFDE